jgi:hypothetical protein
MSRVYVKVVRKFLPHQMLVGAASHHLESAKKQVPGYFYERLSSLMFSALAIEAIGNTYGEVLIQSWKDFETCMRGTSRREDAAFWMIQLTEAQDVGESQNGARFVARFLKNRNSTEAECPPLEWRFQLAKGETRAGVSWKKLSTQQLFRQCIEDGLTSATDIADEMGISKGQVSKLATAGIHAGWLVKDGREYKLTGQA